MIRRFPKRRDQRQLGYLSRSELLEETGAPGLLREAIVLVSGCVLAFVIWAAIAELEEVADTAGEILPAGSLQTVQHLEGGIVTEILVEPGELVAAGRPLVRLDPTTPRAEMHRLRAREAALLLRTARLRAFAERREPDFSGLETNFPDLAGDQRRGLAAQNRVRDSKRQVHANLILQRQAQLQSSRHNVPPFASSWRWPAKSSKCDILCTNRGIPRASRCSTARVG
jgi:HlyD family secretion protein/adhesin transport system membrane fusion protein